MSASPANNKSAAGEAPSHSIWRLIRHDRWRIFISFLLALFTWQSLKDISYERRVRIIPNITPHFKPSAATREIDIISMSRASLELNTSFWNRDKLYTADQFRLELDSEKLVFDNDPVRTQPQRFRYPLTPDCLQLPEDVTLRGFSPPIIIIEWDRRLPREIPIYTRVQNFLPPHIEYRLEYASGPNVRLNGPNYLLNQIPSVETDPITISYGRRESFTLKLPLKVQEIKQKGIECEREEVTVKVHITDTLESLGREITGVRLKILSRPDNPVELAPDAAVPSEVTIFVTGPRREVEALRPDSIIACCDASAFSAGSYNAEVKILNLPPNVTVTSVTPANLQLKMVPRAQAPSPAAKP